MKTMKKAIIGAGGHAREVFWSLSTNDQSIAVFFVDDEYWSSNVDSILPLSKFDPYEYEAIVAIGSPLVRKRIVDQLPSNTIFFTHIHHSAQLLANDIEIGDGSFIGANSVLTTNITIGEHSILNRGTHIGHDTKIGKYFSAMPGTIVSGDCKIGDYVYLGTNSSIREKINICDNVTLGLNSGVVKNISDPGVYAGTPTKKIKV